MSNLRIFLRIFDYLRPYQWRLVGACLCSIMVAGLTAAYAWLVRPVLDGIFIDKNEALLLLLPIALLLVALLKGAFAYGQAYLMSYVGNRIIADIRHQLFRHIIDLPVRFHHEHASGQLVSRITHDVNQMGQAVPNVLKDLLQQGLTFVGLVGWVFYLNWKLASVLLVIVPVSMTVIVRIGRRLRRLATRGQESMGDMASVLKEIFTGIQIVKGYGQEQREEERFRKSNHSYMRANVKSAQLAALTSPLMEVIAIAGITVIIWYGGHLVISGMMTPGAFFSFLTALFMAYAPIRRLAGANTSIQTTIAAAKRVFDVLDQENEHQVNTGKTILPPLSQAIEFRHVSFRYAGSTEWALQDVNLTIRQGEVVALVGKSGSGKTTLVNLVPRFYTPTKGEILIDGRNIQEVTLSSLRSQIGIVSQDTVLFDETIRANIAYGRQEASDDEIIQAAKLAYAWEFIEALPHGLETVIGEDGVKLSGGQRQRLAIARAILRDPPLLILDEATSSLDSESERIVQYAMANLMANRTTLVIAHRLSTIQHADRIVVLSHGKIVETGTHTELLQRNGAYKQLYLTQFHEQPLESLRQ
ncbi:MAG: lipid A export permease/ATP-binding protein MsbA [Nitrospirae bacterium]|nr:MAG: lipid A export permease/ATP-binding protein MsbA [Nitrospirota bacterium]